MKVYVYPADNWGCGHYRSIWPAKALQAQGHDVTVVEVGGSSMIGGKKNKDGDDLEAAYWPPDADVIVLQRPANKWVTKAIPFMRRAGVAVVVEVDDDLSHIDRNNPAWAGLHPKRHPDDNWQWIAEAARNATMVTVSTNPLVEVYGSRHGRWAVLPNCIPQSFLNIEHLDSDIVGWAGALHSHPSDPQLASLATQQHEASGGRVMVVGPDEPGLQRALGLSRPPVTTGIVEFLDWGSQVTRLGIGLAPLLDTRFNRAKSWLKVLEYAALGVPSVASALPEYERFASLHYEGACLLATRPRDWSRQVRRLTSDIGLRVEMSHRARAIAACLTIEEHAKDWWEAWETAHYLAKEDA